MHGVGLGFNDRGLLRLVRRVLAAESSGACLWG